MRKFLLFLFSVLLYFGATAQNTYCSGAIQICIDSLTSSYPAAVYSGNAEPGPDYGCLFSQPSPKWFYIVIQEYGEVDIQIQSNSSVDIDYILWGPFGDLNSICTAQLTDSNVIDCDYSFTNPFTFHIPNATTNSVFMLLVTNFSNEQTLISFKQVNYGQDSAGKVFCILPPSDVSSNSPVCENDTLKLFSPYISGANYTWTGPSGFVSNAQNPVISGINMSNRGNYYLNVTLAPLQTGSAQVYFDIYPLPTANFSYNTYYTFVGFLFNCIDYTSCLWDFGDGTYDSTISNPNHDYASGGTYVVKLIAYNDCGSDTMTKTITLISNGLDDLQNSKIELYPNPTVDKCFIDGIPLRDITRIECRSIEGKLLFEGHPPGLKDGSNTVLDLSAFSPGIYLLKIQTSRNTYFAKIVRSNNR
jgi:PKD repeat protein